jgi:DNA-binding protein YbaB
MQNALAGETVTSEKGGIKVVMNGNMEINSIIISEDMTKEKIASIMTDVINSAIKDTQKLMAKKLQEIGGIPGLN